MTKRSVLFLQLLVLACLVAVSFGETLPLKDFPDEEKKLANSVDPWGLTFSDQMARFQSYFQDAPQPDFVVGYTHNLVKVWPNKYWFRGEIVQAASAKKMEPIWAATGSTVSFQVAILPKTGAAAAAYKVEASAPLPVTICREEFVKLGPAPYLRFQSDYWPDPLVRESTCQIAGANLAVFLCEIQIPRDVKATSLVCEVSVTKDGGAKATFSVPVEVVPLEIRPNDFPLVAWFGQGKLTEAQFKSMCAMVLSHHLQPLIQEDLRARWKPEAPEAFEQFVEFLFQNGQTIVQLWNPPDEKAYQFIKQKGWLARFIAYSNTDEPPEDVFIKTCIPYAAEIRAKFPGLRIFLASECHARIAEGCDIVLTDLSSSKYDPRTFACPPGVELWHYYCHLPINYQMRAPLTLAPNMEIDNDALQHRLALWMSWFYKAKGVLIWSGNSEWPALGEGFWTTREIENKEADYPYGGIHHGNGFLVYPPREAGGEVLPSLRLKVLRDGMEDIAMFEAIRRKYGKDCESWMSPVPDVYQHPQYFDQLPDGLLKKRAEILKKVRQLEGAVP